MPPNENNNTPLSIAAIAAVATGIWSIFNNSNNSNNNHNQKEIETYFNQAVALIQQGNYHQATQIFLTILQLNPQHAPTYNYLAWIYAIHNYQLDQALAFAKNAVQLANSNLDKACFIDTLAEVYAHRQELDTAINLSIECLQIFQNINQYPNSPITYFRLAWCYQIKQDLNQTYHFIQQAMKLNGIGANEHLTIGDICYAVAFNIGDKGAFHESLPHFDNAIKHYEISLNIAQKQNLNLEIFRFKLSSCLNDKARVFVVLEDYQNSQNLYHQSHNVYTSNPYPLVNLALLAARAKNKPQMVLYLTKVMPLIVDMPPYVQKEKLIYVLLTDVDFDDYKEDILGFLFNNGKINQYEYTKFLKTAIKSNQPIMNFSQQNFYADVTGVAGNVEGNFMYQPQCV
ncbi:tetratricopeptide repeat protein [Calothrix sp. CCY 0018]|uniref:tetratricopeptide repeat protein n=1 Tax=Calothrix sp. CCY 0018 TaxID=3103864 RepID=UPI0039C7129C